MMFAEAENSTNPQPYIAAVFSSNNIKENMFVLGDGRITSDSISDTSHFKEYLNGPLEPGTGYSIFQRIIINDKGDYYSTDWSPVSQTTSHPVQASCTKSEGNDAGSNSYLVGMIVLIILLIASFVIIACLAYQKRRSRLQNTSGNSTKEDKKIRHIFLMYQKLVMQIFTTPWTMIRRRIPNFRREKVMITYTVT
ncbi:uncharacterized protein LOC114541144 [Dendronephthya gigantea]|uniref:uncharacterized protein LOC114541144 n=1 Tax=Dendronephthya gigantea TaxID=151771 RepID=UPI00106D33A5|nr:uncharacterized protein LOC114541144 [Dendronephthya gigantea]